MAKNKILNVRVSPELHKSIEDYCKSYNCNTSGLFRRAIKDKIGDLTLEKKVDDIDYRLKQVEKTVNKIDNRINQGY